MVHGSDGRIGIGGQKVSGQREAVGHYLSITMVTSNLYINALPRHQKSRNDGQVFKNPAPSGVCGGKLRYSHNTQAWPEFGESVLQGRRVEEYNYLVTKGVC